MTSRSLWAALALFACRADATAPTDGPPTTPPVTDPLADLPQGAYLLNLAIAPIGGLAVPFQAEVETHETADGPEFARFDLRAVDGDDVSDVLVGLTDLPVTAEGFVAELPEFVLPADYSITGSDVSVLATLDADEATADGFCGTVTGSLPTFSLVLDGSTFGALPWDRRTEEAPSACAAPTVEEVPRITDCPTVQVGRNTLLSGGTDRELEIVLPSQYDPSGSWPLVVVYHGFGGDIAGMLDGTDLRRHADELGTILAVPQALVEGGETLWDAFSDPATNLDAVLFDDLVTCTGESFAVDPDRIHVTGMSNGGLMTGYLVATRSTVIASAAPMSGGITTTYDDSGYDMPALVVWGGVSDVAFGQDFDVLAADMIGLLLAEGHFVVACDHGLGHELDPTFWPWVLGFLIDHPRDLVSEPYAGGLPSPFPAYCQVR